MLYTLTLSNGNTITGLTQNGMNYISPIKIDESIFQDNLSTITFTPDSSREVETYSEKFWERNQETGKLEQKEITRSVTHYYDTIVMHNAELIQQVHYDFADGWWLCFREVPIQEENSSITTLNAKLEYIAMMTDIDLEEV